MPINDGNDSGYTERTVELGGEIDACHVSLRVMSENLDPGAIGLLLKASPTLAFRKGDSRGKGRRVIVREGIWILESSLPEQAPLGAHIEDVLSRTSDELVIWQELARLHRLDIHCGIHVRSFNRGSALSPELCRRVAERGLTLELDIYCEDDGT